GRIRPAAARHAGRDRRRGGGGPGADGGGRPAVRPGGPRGRGPGPARTLRHRRLGGTVSDAGAGEARRDAVAGPGRGARSEPGMPSDAGAGEARRDAVAGPGRGARSEQSGAVSDWGSGGEQADRGNPAPLRRSPARGWRQHWRAHLITIGVLLAVWLALWGRISVPLVVIGLLLAVLVLVLFPLPPIEFSFGLHPWRASVLLARFAADVIAASLQVAYLAVRPRPPTTDVV